MPIVNVNQITYHIRQHGGERTEGHLNAIACGLRTISPSFVWATSGTTARRGDGLLLAFMLSNTRRVL